MPRVRGGRGRGKKSEDVESPPRISVKADSRPKIQRNEFKQPDDDRKQKEAAENAKRLAQERAAREALEAARRAKEEEARRKQEEEEALALSLQLEKERRIEEERRRLEEERRRLDEEAAIEFRRQEERKMAEQNAQRQKNEALIAARKKIEEARQARAKEEQMRLEKLKLEIAQKEAADRRMREENEMRVRQEIEVQEASLRAEEARLREMQETELLRREMESRGASGSSSARSNSSTQRSRDLKRKATMEPSQLDDQIVRVYSKLQIPETGSSPSIPLQKLRDGVYRFGTRNIFVEAWENECGVAVRQGMYTTPFDEFVKKYHKTEVLKIKGMACLGGFMGPGYV